MNKKKAKFLIFFLFKQSKVQGIPRWATIQVQPPCSVTTVSACKIDQIDLRLLRKKWFL